MTASVVAAWCMSWNMNHVAASHIFAAVHSVMYATNNRMNGSEYDRARYVAAYLPP